MGVKLGFQCRMEDDKNKMQRGLFTPKKEKVIEEWRKLCNEKLHSL
jgi:hypothetical protein